MNGQLDLFDVPQDEPTPFAVGMQLSAKAAEKWTPAQVAAVDDAIRWLAYFRPIFTADDVWNHLPDGFPVTKGLAARLNVAARAGLIRATDRTMKAARGGNHDHGQRLTVWQSLGVQR